MNGPPVVLTARHYWFLTIAFLLFVIYGSYVPLTTRSLSLADALDVYARRMSRGISFESRSDWVANVMLFVPLGFLAAGSISVDRFRPVALIALIPAMALLSAAIEFFQLWFPDRNTTPNDVAAETLGGIIGVVGWWAIGTPFTHRVRQVWANLGPGDWAARALPFYLLFLVIAHGMPFDLTLSPGLIKRKFMLQFEPDYEAGWPIVGLSPHSSQLMEKALLHAVFFVPVGALLAFLPGVAWRSRQGLGRVAASGLAICLGIELIQVIVVSAGAYASDVLLGTILVVAGWWSATRRETIPPRTWALACGVWISLILLAMWSPFSLDISVLGDRLKNAVWVPFVDYYGIDYVRAFNAILNRLLLFLPVGFLLARLRQIAVWQAGLAGMMVAAAVELGQAVMTTRTISTSDVVIAGVGATLGGIVARRLANMQTTPAPIVSPEPAPQPARNKFFY